MKLLLIFYPWFERSHISQSQWTFTLSSSSSSMDASSQISSSSSAPPGYQVSTTALSTIPFHWMICNQPRRLPSWSTVTSPSIARVIDGAIDGEYGTIDGEWASTVDWNRSTVATVDCKMDDWSTVSPSIDGEMKTDQVSKETLIYVIHVFRDFPLTFTAKAPFPLISEAKTTQMPSFYT